MRLLGLSSPIAPPVACQSSPSGYLLMLLRTAPLRAPSLIGRRVSPVLSQRGLSCRPSCAARSAPRTTQQGLQQHPGSGTSLQNAISKGMVNHILPFKRPGSGLRLAPRRPQQDEFELDTHGEARLKLKTAGWNQWEWRGHKINFVSAGGSWIITA